MKDNAAINALLKNAIDPLTWRAERRLIAKARRGDKAAEDKLYRSNLKYAVTVALRYRSFLNENILIEDLVAVAISEGFPYALKMFDGRGRAGMKFIAYADRAMRSKIRLYISRNHKSFKQSLTRFWTEPWAKSLSLDAESVGSQDLRERLGDDDPRIAQIEMDDEYAHVMEVAKSVLTGRELSVLLGWSEGKFLGELAKPFGLSRERARQIKEEAIDKIRAGLSRDGIRARSIKLMCRHQPHIHLNDGGRQLCGCIGNPELTDDPDEVTCLGCLKKMGRAAA